MDENLSNQIQLFKSVFKGREDVFAVRWEKPARPGGGENKSGYMPAYFYDPYMYRAHKIKGGTFQNYKDKTYLKLTDKEIAKHLNGEQLIAKEYHENSLLVIATFIATWCRDSFCNEKGT